MVQEIAITLNTRKNLATTTLIFAVFVCLFVYLLQIGILSQTSQQLKEREGEQFTLQKDNFSLTTQAEGLNSLENKIVALDFVKAGKIKYIPVYGAYIATAHNLVKATKPAYRQTGN